ncbi:UDP-glucuronosyltransferase-like [Notolabrus celidotus]|uniref:UDP-glucuronosyltransferase-like n=1 Tax=Notolabrus celidotus TaxID=1203425 RepID=UPI00148FCD34|nr:UDP-glucuronosyltransferase-like [Notolabrus celidotus]
MWRVVVFVFLLSYAEVHVNVAADEKPEFGSDASKPVENVQTEETEFVSTSPTSAPAASQIVPGNLLVIPMDGSHWVDIKALTQEMGRRGHRVTVVMPEVTMRMGPGEHYNTLTYPVPYDKATIDQFMSSHKNLMDKSAASFIEKIRHRFSRLQQIQELIHTTAENLLFNDTLISHLGQQGFDAVLTDPVVPTGALIARKLGLPIVNVLRGIPCSLDMKAAGCPSPPSYVPRFFTGYTDKMNFKERTFNTMVALLEPLFCRLLYWRFDNIAHQFLGEKVGMAEVLSESAIWLLRFDFTLELPRPLMPNMVLIGGINCNVRNPLPKDLESWVSGKDGFIVFTLGSMVSDMPEETTSIFLEAFRQIPQKVIWRYGGKVPDNVPDNVKMMHWVPQNDLLAQPGVRAFITHAGSHGLYEGLCHAVPMLMLPIAGDQPDNAKRLASRDVGIVMDLFTVTTESLLQGLNEVINDSRYKENVQRLSALHKDRPMDPIDLSVYWTEFVMRHKGAKHLRPAVHDLNWLQYFSLDVIAFLMTVLLICVIVTVKCFKLCFRKLARKRKQE